MKNELDDMNSYIKNEYFNRELSWLEFNRRVLCLAEDFSNPLFERIKYLSIFESNLDEFYMIRVSGLMEQLESAQIKLPLDGLTTEEQLCRIRKVTQDMRDHASTILMNKIIPDLKNEGIEIVSQVDLNKEEKRNLEQYFITNIFPLCTPILLYPCATIPFISNKSLNIIVTLKNKKKPRIARIKVPNISKQYVSTGVEGRYMMIEDVIKNNLDHFFKDIPVQNCYDFRVIRDGDFEMREIEASDLIEAIEQTLHMRRFGDPVLLEVSSEMPAELIEKLCELLDITEDSVIKADGILGLGRLHEISKLDRKDLQYVPFVPSKNNYAHNTDKLFKDIKEKDIVIHHPYQSFDIIENFVASGMTDPSVIGLKQTLYRVGKRSPIVESLLNAAELDKQVAVLIELKARFDENNNLIGARSLERAGVHVSYGFNDLKTHCKLCLVVRKEEDGIQSYVHVGTGNYNPVTARIYTDLGLLTCDEDIIQDVLELFNVLTGYSKHSEYRKLLVSPVNTRSKILEKISREANHAKKGRKAHIAIKMNSLVDREMIDALYFASESGVKIDLIVRGICCLRPGLTGKSENIRVISIVGRFLEHSRVFYFYNDDSSELYIGSADLMSRNLDRRIEVLAPIQNKKQINKLKNEFLDVYFKDNQDAWELNFDGTYTKKMPMNNEEDFSAQEYFMNRVRKK